jgi:hypothetical protein
LANGRSMMTPGPARVCWSGAGLAFPFTVRRAGGAMGRSDGKAFPVSPLETSIGLHPAKSQPLLRQVKSA